ncbi:MAG: cation-translocating P-type ATPase [Nitrososphaerota archaeon]|nr:cation-translocating P-type ATPase [Aigarchaeota archaeon]MDW8077214.1 cation-translocating P-type ATPase [Nitrososphaerota archaeon]
MESSKLAVENWHAISVDEVVARLRTDPEKGLTSDEVMNRLSIFGPNEIERVKKVSGLKIFLRQFKNVLILLLLAATSISALLGEFIDSILIFVIVMAAVILGFVQELRAEKALEALKKMLSPRINIIRDGKVVNIATREIVPGDVLLLEAGDKVPADARLIHVVNLQVNEAPLTGESVPVLKQVEPLPVDVGIADRRCMVFAGTTVTYGKGRCIVVATGMNTELGRIARTVAAIEKEETPLERKTKEIGNFLVKVVMIVISLIAIAGILEELFLHSGLTVDFIIEMMIFAVALAVAAVPEALPAIVTGTLAIGMYVMAKHNALVRRMSAVETLGCTQVICSDKTGTLTKGEMTVVQLFVSGKSIRVSGVGYEPRGEFFDNGKVVEPDDSVQLLLKAGSLCNDAQLVNVDRGWSIVGDPTEGALVVVARKAGIDELELRRTNPRVFEVPFSSERKKMTTVHKVPDGSLVAYMKGAVEVVLDSCDKVILDGKEAQLSKELRSRVLMINDDMATNGLRVLAVAYRRIENEDYSDVERLEKNFTLIGLFGMMDPPREDAVEAIKTCKQVHIKPVMITGDYKQTALAVAKSMRIYEEGDIVLTGQDLEKIDEAKLSEMSDKVTVYARVSPLDKLKIVKAWKRRGKVVAMTGDGVNDAPALKQADIGVAMGITGTEVSKEAADMVLSDDNFATIVKAIELGRWIYDNIKKFLLYLLESNIVEVVVIAVLVLLGFPLPLLPVHILYINLATDGLPAIALGLAPPEPGLMSRPPRDPKESVFSREIKFLLALIASIHTPFFIWIFFSNVGRGIDVARTMLFLSFVIVELSLALNLRSIRYPISKVKPHKWLLLAILWEVFMLFMIVNLESLRSAFQLVPLSPQDIVVLALSAALPFIEFELVKRVAPNLLIPESELKFFRTA